MGLLGKPARRARLPRSRIGRASKAFDPRVGRLMRGCFWLFRHHFGGGLLAVGGAYLLAARKVSAVELLSPTSLGLLAAMTAMAMVWVLCGAAMKELDGALAASRARGRP